MAKKYDVTAQERILTEAADAYFNGTPTMSDAEYDKIWRKHRQVREAYPDQFPANCILDRVGAEPRGTKIKHQTPMLSLDNVFEDAQHGCEALVKWLAGVRLKCPGVTILVEPKIDGLSVNLRYQDGKLVSAATRGDGLEGDDCLPNVLASKMVPTTVGTWTGEIRGEVYMTHKAFEALNKRQEEAGEELYANPRNAAAGALRLQDPAESASRGLSFLLHGMYPEFEEYSKATTFLWESGMPCVPHLKVESESPDIGDLKTRLLVRVNYPIDGIVFKVDQLIHRWTLGDTSRAPRWAVALKFLQERVTTTLKAITVQVGRSGVLTPTADFDPVVLDGSVVRRATLHNEEQVRRLGLQIGDEVVIEKAGGIIPAIIGSVTHEQCLGDERPPFDLIKHIGGKCPACRSTDLRKQQVDGEDGARWMCLNPHCVARLAARLRHLASRSALDIEMLGGEAADALARTIVDECSESSAVHGDPYPDWVQMIRWLFDVKAEWLAKVNWTTESGGTMKIGKARAEKIRASLERAKTLPLNRWLVAWGIHTVGVNTSREISRLVKFPRSLEYEAEGDCLFGWIVSGSTEVKERYQISHHLGPVSAQEMIDFVRSESGKLAIDMMEEFQIMSDNYAPFPMKEDKKLTGKTFVVTGTLSVKRDEFQRLLVEAGATIGSGVTSKTSYLVAGEDCGSKLEKAQKLGVQILTEEQARAML
jgi:DNA ligase (NAD+)